LHANILIGTNILEYYRLILDIANKKIIAGTCKNIVILIQTEVTAIIKGIQGVYNAHRIVIPPFSPAQIAVWLNRPFALNDLTFLLEYKGARLFN
jgi:hypothetical protein